MNKTTKRTPVVVPLRPSSYQPSKAELEEDMSIPDTTPEALGRAVISTVRIETIDEDG